MVYGIFRKNAKPNNNKIKGKISFAVPIESGFKTKLSAVKHLKKIRMTGLRGYKVVKLK